MQVSAHKCLRVVFWDASSCRDLVQYSFTRFFTISFHSDFFGGDKFSSYADGRSYLVSSYLM